MGITKGKTDVRHVRVRVAEGYDVMIGAGLLSECGMLLAGLSAPCRVAVISDDTVAALYLSAVRDSLMAAGFTVVTHVFPHGEEHKTLATFSGILDFLAASGLTRSDLLVALGGGVVGDVAGFAAASYMRGIRYVQMPTTLLAAVDSSVGGKTAVDLPVGKNLVGAFHQPSAVICDTDCLDTLPASTFADGCAEALKYGVLCDEELFELIAAADPADRARIIERCVRIKALYVEADEHEAGERRFLNLGHTVGHAIERCSSYTVTHGQAVAIGMVIIARACERLGRAQAGTTDCITAALERLGLPTSTAYGANELARAALSDKKRSGDAITIVGIERVGACYLESMPVQGLIDLLTLGCEERS